MKPKINWIYLVIIIILMICISVSLDRIQSLENRVKQLEDKTTSIELRLEDTSNNDDLL